MKPIILIPGIFGSKLVATNPKTGERKIVWPIDKMTDVTNFREQVMYHLWGKPNKDGYFEAFSGWEVDAVPSFAGVEKLVENSFTKLFKVKHFNYFHDLVLFLEQQGYVKDTNLFAYSYDWRQSAAIPFSVQRFQTFLANVNQITGQKPIIIGHSMGGLIVKYFMHLVVGWSKHFTDFITCGTPHDGSTGYLLMVGLTGYGLGLPFINDYTRGIWANSGMLYNLWPSSGATGLSQSIYYKIAKTRKESYLQQLPNEIELLKSVSVVKPNTYIGRIFTLLKEGNLSKITQCSVYVKRGIQLGVLKCSHRIEYQEQDLCLKKPKLQDFFHQDYERYVHPVVQEYEWRQLTLWAPSQHLEMENPRLIPTHFVDIKCYNLQTIEFTSAQLADQVNTKIRGVVSQKQIPNLINIVQMKGLRNLHSHNLQPEFPNRSLLTPQDSLIDFLHAVTPDHSIEQFVFGTDYGLLRLHKKARQQLIVYPKEFRFGSLSGSGILVNCNVAFTQPVNHIEELRYQKPELLEADGDGSVSLVSATSDYVPEQYVVNRFVLDGVKHGGLIKEPSALACIWELIQAMCI